MIQIDLHPAVSRDELDDGVVAAGLLLVNIVPRSDTHPAQTIYVAPDRQSFIHLVDGDALCFMVQGATEERWARVLRELPGLAAEARA